MPQELIGSGFRNVFDQLARILQASEASTVANPGCEFMYGVWTQWAHDEVTGELLESDAMAPLGVVDRRLHSRRYLGLWSGHGGRHIGQKPMRRP